VRSFPPEAAGARVKILSRLEANGFPTAEHKAYMEAQKAKADGPKGQ